MVPWPKTVPAKTTKYILYWNEAYGTYEYEFCCGQVTIDYSLQCKDTTELTP